MSELSEKIMELSTVMCSECKNHTNCDWYYRPSQLAICPEDAKAILSLIREEVEKVKGENPNEQQSDAWYKESYLKGDSGYVAEGSGYLNWNQACDRILELLEGK